MSDSLGKRKRMDKILNENGKTIIVPIDDLLISGTGFHLEDYKAKIELLSNDAINAILGFPGVFKQFYKELRNKAWIVNLSTSITGVRHTNKKISITLENAILMGCDAVAVHVNITSPEESEMIQTLGIMSCECNKLGIPLMAIMYVRKPSENEDDNYLLLKERNNDEYTRMVSHACRIAVELDVDIIKTNYTGSSESFQKVIYSSGNVPVVIAGGKKVSEEVALNNAKKSLIAGSAGVCFGRNVFYRDNIPEFLGKLNNVVKKK